MSLPKQLLILAASFALAKNVYAAPAGPASESCGLAVNRLNLSYVGYDEVDISPILEQLRAKGYTLVETDQAHIARQNYHAQGFDTVIYGNALRQSEAPFVLERHEIIESDREMFVYYLAKSSARCRRVKDATWDERWCALEQIWNSPEELMARKTYSPFGEIVNPVKVTLSQALSLLARLPDCPSRGRSTGDSDTGAN